MPRPKVKKNNSELVLDSLTQIYNKLNQTDHTKPSEKTMEMFNSLNGKIDSIHNALFGVEESGGLVKQINSIEEQTKKTNGRVNSLEGWKLYITGGMAVICLIGLPMMWVLLNDVKELRESKITLNK